MFFASAMDFSQQILFGVSVKIKLPKQSAQQECSYKLNISKSMVKITIVIFLNYFYTVANTLVASYFCRLVY